MRNTLYGYGAKYVLQGHLLFFVAVKLILHTFCLAFFVLDEGDN